MPNTWGIPTYRRRLYRDRTVAVVTLTDSETGKRRDFCLGDYGSDESRERYAQIIATWTAASRRLPGLSETRHQPTGPTVAQLCLFYWNHVQGRHGPGHERVIRAAIRFLRTLYGSQTAVRFGPVKLRTVRDAMIAGDPKRQRPPWTRKTVKTHMQVILSIFRWAVSSELIPIEVYQALLTLEPLKRGQTAARESEPVKPADLELIKAARDRVSNQVRAMIDLQLATGMRPGEVCAMCPCDIDMSGEVWLYRPAAHKTQHFGRDRIIYLGPRSQDVIRPFLKRPISAFLFSPAEVDRERRAEQHQRRKTPLSCGNKPGSNVKENPKRKPGERFDVSSYRRAIYRACDTAFPVPKRLKKNPEAAETWRKQHRWHPHQLRHNYATEVRRQYGLEAAQLLLGHSSALITDAVYAERDQAKAAAVAAAMG